MRFRKVFTISAIALKKIRDSIQSKAIYSQIAPIIHNIEYFLLYIGIVKIQIGLM